MHSLYGIIGNPLSHSFSPAYFTAKFAREQIDAEYGQFELKNINEFPLLLRTHWNLKGLNVTIPYKQLIIPYLSGLSDAAKLIGAVNCIDITTGKLTGYNTDVIGFERSLLPILQPEHKKALVLGTGGSSLAVKYVLKKLGIDFLSVSRAPVQGAISYFALTPDLVRDHLLIINTTPVGMYPQVNALPDIPYEAITSKHLLFDLIYNPQETKFLAAGNERGAITSNGLTMLHLQAEASWEIWNGNHPTV